MKATSFFFFFFSDSSVLRKEFQEQISRGQKSIQASWPDPTSKLPNLREYYWFLTHQPQNGLPKLRKEYTAHKIVSKEGTQYKWVNSMSVQMSLLRKVKTFVIDFRVSRVLSYSIPQSGKLWLISCPFYMLLPLVLHCSFRIVAKLLYHKML